MNLENLGKLFEILDKLKLHSKSLEKFSNKPAKKDSTPFSLEGGSFDFKDEESISSYSTFGEAEFRHASTIAVQGGAHSKKSVSGPWQDPNAFKLHDLSLRAHSLTNTTLPKNATTPLKREQNERKSPRFAMRKPSSVTANISTAIAKALVRRGSSVYGPAGAPGTPRKVPLLRRSLPDLKLQEVDKLPSRVHPQRRCKSHGSRVPAPSTPQTKRMQYIRNWEKSRSGSRVSATTDRGTPRVKKPGSVDSVSSFAQLNDDLTIGDLDNAFNDPVLSDILDKIIDFIDTQFREARDAVQHEVQRNRVELGAVNLKLVNASKEIENQEMELQEMSDELAACRSERQMYIDTINEMSRTRNSKQPAVDLPSIAGRPRVDPLQYELLQKKLVQMEKSLNDKNRELETLKKGKLHEAQAPMISKSATLGLGLHSVDSLEIVSPDIDEVLDPSERTGKVYTGRFQASAARTIEFEDEGSVRQEEVVRDPATHHDDNELYQLQEKLLSMNIDFEAKLGESRERETVLVHEISELNERLEEVEAKHKVAVETLRAMADSDAVVADYQVQLEVLMREREELEGSKVSLTTLNDSIVKDLAKLESIRDHLMSAFDDVVHALAQSNVTGSPSSPLYYDIPPPQDSLSSDASDSIQDRRDWVLACLERILTEKDCTIREQAAVLTKLGRQLQDFALLAEHATGVPEPAPPQSVHEPEERPPQQPTVPSVDTVPVAIADSSTVATAASESADCHTNACSHSEGTPEKLVKPAQELNVQLTADLSVGSSPTGGGHVNIADLNMSIQKLTEQNIALREQLAELSIQTMQTQTQLDPVGAIRKIFESGMIVVSDSKLDSISAAIQIVAEKVSHLLKEHSRQQAMQLSQRPVSVSYARRQDTQAVLPVLPVLPARLQPETATKSHCSAWSSLCCMNTSNVSLTPPLEENYDSPPGIIPTTRTSTLPSPPHPPVAQYEIYTPGSSYPFASRTRHLSIANYEMFQNSTTSAR